MPATCLNKIISIRGCDDETSLSGFDLFDLPGISLPMAASIADPGYVQGKALLKDKRRLALLKIKNDLMKFLHAHGFIANLFSSLWRSGEYRSRIVEAGTAGEYRGLIFYTKQEGKKACNLRRMFIPAVYVKSNHSGDTILTIVDGPNEYDYDITLYAGKTVKVNVNFRAEYEDVMILLPSDIEVYSADPYCDCPDKKSDCVKVLGINNNVTNTSETYGITADVQCECDYDLLLCSLASKGLMGEVVLYKTGVEIMDERLKTERLNYFTTYGHDEAKSILREWEGKYGDAWNTLIAALPQTLPQIDGCGCLSCGGTKIRANI